MLPSKKIYPGNTMTFKDEWTLKSAMEILAHPTVDSKLWSEAVEWLLLHGPPEIQTMLQQASGHATQKTFPELEPEGFTPEGEPCYNIQKLAQSLGITEEEVAALLEEKAKLHGRQEPYILSEDDSKPIQ
jgi:hypothetical protein